MALLGAAMCGSEGEVRAILARKNSNVNECDAYGDTALHQAAQYGHEKIISLLLEENADVNAVNNAGSTALHKAALKGHNEILRLLLKAGADPMIENKSGLRAESLARTPQTKELLFGESSISDSVQVPEYLISGIIGRKGGQIRRIQQQTSTFIRINNLSEEEKLVAISGRRENVDAAKKIILDYIANPESLEQTPVANNATEPKKRGSNNKLKAALKDPNMVVKRMTIPKDMHTRVIGRGGATVRRINRTTKANIWVPPSTDESEEIAVFGKSEASVAEAVELVHAIVEENTVLDIVGKHTDSRHGIKYHQHSPKKGKKMEVRNLGNQKLIVEVPKPYHRLLIGKKGATFTKLTESSGASIKIPRPEMGVDEIYIFGTEEQMKNALTQIEEIVHRHAAEKGYGDEHRGPLKMQSIHVDVNDEFVKTKCPLPCEKHKLLIGRNGGMLRDLQELEGVSITIPDEKLSENYITIEGPMGCVHRTLRNIEAITRKAEGEQKDAVKGGGPSSRLAGKAGGKGPRQREKRQQEEERLERLRQKRKDELNR